MKYSYTAAENNGQIVSGVLEAASAKAARVALERRTLSVVRLDALHQRGRSLNQLPLLQRMLLAQHLSTMLRAGVSLLEALRVIRQETRSRQLRSVLDRVIGPVDGGLSLAGALEAQGRSFDPLFVSLVRVGESSGTLEDNLGYLADELEKRIALRSKVRSALLYPAIVLGVTVGLGVLLVFFVLPRIVPLFDSLKVNLPVSTQVLLKFATFIRHSGFSAAVALVAAIAAIGGTVHIPAVRVRFHRCLLSVPLVGRVVRAVNLANFCRTLGTLTKSGVPITEALEVTGATMRSLAYQRQVQTLRDAIASGTSLAAAVTLHSKRAFFPPMTVSLIRVGEASGKLDDSLLYLNRFYEREVDSLMKDLAVVLEPTLLLIIGLAVAFVVSAIISPIYQITGSLRTR